MEKSSFECSNSNKNLPISVLRTEPEYKREVLSIHLQFKQADAVRDLLHHQHLIFKSATFANILTNPMAPFLGRRLLFPLDIVRPGVVNTKASEYIEQNLRWNYCSGKYFMHMRTLLVTVDVSAPNLIG